MYLLADILVRIVRCICVEKTKVLLCQLDLRTADIEGQLDLLIGSVVGLPVHILEYDLGSPIHRTDAPAVLCLFGILITAVKDDHVRIAQLIHHYLLHIRHIHIEGSGIHKGNDLNHCPALGHTDLEDLVQLPHTVVLDHYIFRLILSGKLQKIVCGQCLIRDELQENILFL